MKNQKGNISIIVSFVIVVFIIGIIVYALIHKTALAPEKTVEEQNITSTEVTNKLEDNKTQTKSMEQTAKNGDVLTMNYTGHLTNGTVFDSNIDPKFNHVQPFQFTLGAGQVIAGWDEGLVGMKIGEKKTLTIPPEKGYGSQAIGSIPANSTLIFDVELVAIK